MFKKMGYVFALLTFSLSSHAGISVANNSEINVSLSANNFNRILIKDDEIWDFVFPPKSLGIKQDKGDHSIYILPSNNPTIVFPITLFLTTKLGRHYTVTVNKEDSLGKTIEFIPKESMVAQVTTKPVNKTSVSHDQGIPGAITALLIHMEQHKPFADVSIKRHFGRVERWNQGLSLQLKETWKGGQLSGETIMLRNNGKAPLHLAQNWFVKEGTLAVKLSKQSIAPQETAVLYRIQGASYG
jgi:conjugal transfer pilus assembly protein TraK